MSAISKIFAVIDPTTDNQIALVRAGKFAGRNENISIHVYEALYSSQDNSDPDALRRVETARHQAWLETLVAPLRGLASRSISRSNGPAIDVMP